MTDVNVVKRDGNVEAWSDDKLIASMGKAGVPLENCEEIAGKVSNWASENALKGNIASTKIRDKVVELMAVDFPAEADSFRSYKK